MDSLTQVVLGGAVGEATLGKKEGNKAALWGMFGGTLPDLDVLTTFFVDEVTQLGIHRGLSHSFLFAVLFSPVLGYLIKKIHRSSEASVWQWSGLMFLALVTHGLLDSFTQYGTQLLYPFTTYPVSFDSISIIDPLYTLPLFLSLAIGMWMRRDHPRRRLLCWLGLGLSTGYLLLTLINKQGVHQTFEARLAEQGIEYEKLYSNPNVGQNLLWKGVADAGDTLWVGTYSIFDQPPYPPMRPLPKRIELLEGGLESAPVKRLMWFSKNYFTIRKEGPRIIWEDHRFPGSDLDLYGNGRPVFAFELVEPPEGHPERFSTFRQGIPQPAAPPGLFSDYWRRMWGHSVNK